MKEKMLQILQIEKVENETGKMKKIVKYLPIIIIQVFYMFCYFLFRFGVWKWTTGSDNKVFFHAGSSDSLFVGIWFGRKSVY